MLKQTKHRKASIGRALRRRDCGKTYLRPQAAVIARKKVRKQASNDVAVLFVKGLNGRWGLPKGGFAKEDKRRLRRAAQRELLEETGLYASHFRYLGSADDETINLAKYPANMKGKTFYIALADKVWCKAPKLHLQAGEITAATWVHSLVEFYTLEMSDRRREIFLAALQVARVPWAMKKS